MTSKWVCPDCGFEMAYGEYELLRGYRDGMKERTDEEL